jgi:NAD(P)-dependent dehydrogenase (short-subunit alcohol dehydrogenase family)
MRRAPSGPWRRCRLGAAKPYSWRLNVSDSASIRAAAGEFANHAAHLDVLVNNAGIYPDRGVNILTVSRELLTRTFQTNTFGPVEVAQAFLPWLRESQAARVINISSGYGQLEGLSPDVPSYCLSKLALNGVTLMLSKALHQEHIAVNAVCPGWVRTDMGGPNLSRPEGNPLVRILSTFGQARS